MGQKWSKAQHKKYSATMKAKREQNGIHVSFPGNSLDKAKEIVARWEREADEAFHALPFWEKAMLLVSRERR